LVAFERALSLGARGLESDIGLTTEGIPILQHLSLFRHRPSPLRPPTLEELFQRCGTDFDLSLDMGEPRAAEAVVRIATRYGAIDRLWLTYWRIPVLQEWRRRWPRLHLVYPTIPLRPSSTHTVIEHLAETQITTINIHYRFCRRALIEQAHARGLLVFAWGVRSGRPLPRLLIRGVDGVFCDDVAEMVAALKR